MSQGAAEAEVAHKLERAVDGHYRSRRRLIMVALAGAIVMGGEIAGGLAANSLVLLADAFHYLGDVAAVLLALAAISYAAKAPTRTKTFGYHRSEVVAAFVNAMALWAIAAYLVWESVRRLADPPDVDGRLVVLVAGATLVANVVMAGALRRGASGNMSVRSAYLHVVSDALGSVAAMMAGLGVHLGGWRWADPAMTLAVTALIVVFAFRLTRDSLHILMEGAPKHLDPNEVQRALSRLPGVREVHDLHVWTLTPGVESVSVHVVLDHAPVGDQALHDVHRTLLDAFGLQHATVQIEDPSCPCDEPTHRAAPAG